jgi:hypothetical protein
MQIIVESDMQGFGLEMPAPLTKAADESLSLTMSIEFPEQGRIDSTGGLGDNIVWNTRFLKEQDGWDFDRGVLAIGGEYPETPEGRGPRTDDRPDRRQSVCRGSASDRSPRNSESWRVRLGRAAQWRTGAGLSHCPV